MDDRLPFVVKLLIAFLLVDGSKRFVELILWMMAQSDDLALVPSPYQQSVPFLIMWVLTEYLLVVLLVLRTTFGRVLTQVLFGAHVLYLCSELAVRHPDMWVYLPTASRIWLLVTLAVDVSILVYLFTPQATRSLDR